VGIIGLGAIGEATASLAKAFGMRVIAIRRSATPETTSPNADEVLGPASLFDLASRSDAVVVCAPDDDSTRNMINDAFFDALKPGAVLCNVARGSLVDEDALIAALESGRVRAAALDVTKEEPLPPDSPLWTAPNIYLSPHSANSMDGYFDRLADLFAENILRMDVGLEVRNEVFDG
jgi:phosphoglycerate dehydrogenase-like enzyme